MLVPFIGSCCSLCMPEVDQMELGEWVTAGCHTNVGMQVGKPGLLCLEQDNQAEMVLRWRWRASCSVAPGAGAGASLLEERITA